MNKFIVSSWRCYTPFGREFYQPMEDYFLSSLGKYRDEFDRLYIIDSQWEVGKIPDWVTVVRTNPNKRYYETYKEIVPSLPEGAVLFLDNDMVIYKKGIISTIFSHLENHDIVSIYDTIGEKKYEELGGQSKFCPYLFASRVKTLLPFLDCEWGPVPWGETLSELTDRILKAGLKPYEMEEDKSNFLFGEELGNKKSRDLGYYHIRAGSTPAYLLSHRKRGDSQYKDWLKNQPKSEYLRQFAWYWIIGGSQFMNKDLVEELGIGYPDWLKYVESFRKYYGL